MIILLVNLRRVNISAAASENKMHRCGETRLEVILTRMQSDSSLELKPSNLTLVNGLLFYIMLPFPHHSLKQTTKYIFSLPNRLTLASAAAPCPFTRNNLSRWWQWLSDDMIDKSLAGDGDDFHVCSKCFLQVKLIYSFYIYMAQNEKFKFTTKKNLHLFIQNGQTCTHCEHGL